MSEIVITKGNYAAIITAQPNIVFARIYTNIREGRSNMSATAFNWTGKTINGAKKWAEKKLEILG